MSSGDAVEVHRSGVFAELISLDDRLLVWVVIKVSCLASVKLHVVIVLFDLVVDTAFVIYRIGLLLGIGHVLAVDIALGRRSVFSGVFDLVLMHRAVDIHLVESGHLEACALRSKRSYRRALSLCVYGGRCPYIDLCLTNHIVYVICK